MSNRVIFPLLGEGGGGGSTAWGQITGNLNNQTDLKNALDLKVDISGLATVATSGDYDDLTNKPSIPAAQIQSDWNQSDNTQVDFIKNKPTLGTMAAESASDYTPTSGLATVATTGSYPDLHNKPTIPAAQVNSDWNAVSGIAQILNKPSMSTETLTFVDANNVSTTVVVYTQPQI